MGFYTKSATRSLSILCIYVNLCKFMCYNYDYVEKKQRFRHLVMIKIRQNMLAQ